MNIAMFVETYEPAMGINKRQVLIVPQGDSVRIWSRVTDGEKGPHNKWEETNLHSLGETMSDRERLTAHPVGVYVTEADKDAITEKGYSPVLGNKAISAHKNSVKTPSGALAKETIEQLYDKVEQADASLQDSIIDLRRGDAPVSEESQPTQTSAASHGKVLSLALATVPAQKFADKYVNRKIFGMQDYEVFDLARANNEDVLLYGPTGPGKTSSVIAWAASRGLRLAQVSGNAALEPSHLIGKDIYDHETGGFAWIDGPVTDVVRNGGVLILDELNFISPKIYTVLYSLLDGRRCLVLLDHHGEVIQAHEDLIIFATMNPEYTGTVPLNFAFRNRFAIQIGWDYDDDVEAQLVKSKTILLIAKQMRNEAAKGEFETPISTNMLMELERFIPIFGYEFAVQNFISHFDKEEQDKVQLVFQTHAYNLQEEFNKLEKELVQDKGDETPSTTPVADEVDSWLKKQPTV